MQTSNSPNSSNSPDANMAPARQQSRAWLWGLAALVVVIVGIFALAGRQTGVPTRSDTPAVPSAAPDAGPGSPEAAPATSPAVPGVQ